MGCAVGKGGFAAQRVWSKRAANLLVGGHRFVVRRNAVRHSRMQTLPRGKRFYFHARDWLSRGVVFFREAAQYCNLPDQVKGGFPTSEKPRRASPRRGPGATTLD